MRISTITNWAYGITVALTALSATAFIMSSRSAAVERQATEEHRVLDTLGEELALGAEIRSDEARLYVMRGEARHLEAFRAEEAAEKRREGAVNRLGSLRLSPSEIEALREIDRDADALDAIEVAAIEAFQKGDTAGAQQILFGPDHERFQTALLGTVAHFRALTATRTDAELENARMISDSWSLAAKLMLGVTGALFLAVLYFILRRRVTVPLARMTGIVSRLAKQDYAVEVPLDTRRDEIGEMNDAIHIFRENGIERDRLDAERRADQHTKGLILQMMHRFQACQTQPELADVVARFMPQIFPETAGRFLLMNAARTELAEASDWNAPQHSKGVFQVDSCWALRRARPHISGIDDDVSCQHIDDDHATSLCVPLAAQGETVGLLYLEESTADILIAGSSRLYLEMIAENVGLAVANLQLRDKLTSLAIRDGLTGLFNRRFLDEALYSYSRGKGDADLVCLMIDIDHFKRFNDDFGHDAGDIVMQYVATIIAEITGDAGSAFRFGGEEFTVLFPGFTEEEGAERAEQMREKIGLAALSHAGRLLGSVTISTGIASARTGASVSALVARADAALLQAKALGRNRTVAASNMPPPDQSPG